MGKRFLTVLFVLMFALGLSGVALARNTANVYQSGDSNEAYIEQIGDFNDPCQWQQGDNNKAYIKIHGSSNTAKQVQLNNSNFAETYIDGDFNTVCQYQDGGETSTIIIHGSHVSVYRY